MILYRVRYMEPKNFLNHEWALTEQEANERVARLRERYPRGYVIHQPVDVPSTAPELVAWLNRELNAPSLFGGI